MEIVVINQAKDKSIYRYKKDYEVIFTKALSLLNRNMNSCLSVIFLTPEQIHEINRDYRNVDRPTDVISFAFQDDANERNIKGCPINLGQIIISYEKAEEQAKEYGHSLLREMSFLFTHGILHLLGYDHMKKEDEIVMFKLQDEILGGLK